MTFKICAIGCGEMAVRGHGPSYQKYAGLHPDLQLAACCDVDEAKASAFRQKFGFARHYTDMVTMLDQEKPDAVCLMAPVHLTAELSIKIMQLGYPLMMEKPPGMDREETMRMIDAANKSGVANKVAFNRRHIPLMTELKAILTDEIKLDNIQNIRYDFYRVNRRDPDFSSTAIHGIDAVKFLAGADYKYIRFHYQEFPHLGEGVTNIYMDCQFQSGATAQLNFCPVAGIVIERATVNALNHTIFLNLPIWGAADSPGKLTHYISGKVHKEISGSDITDSDELYETNGFYAENASFFDDVRAGIKPAGDIASGLQSVEIAECIRMRKSEYRA